jgi:cation diffusion facilitator CzcD-associated flavoprotein CzcO
MRNCSRYSLSTDPNPNWNKEFAASQEIFAYWQDVVTKYKLRDHIYFNKFVDGCKWDEDEQVYHIKISDTTAGGGEHVKDKARVIFSAIGGFLDPRYAPDLPGRDVFKGDMWHSGRWDHSISLSNKKVGVVGNGCSAVQFIPIISEDESVKVINFARSPHWLAPLVGSPDPRAASEGSRTYPTPASIQYRSNHEMDVQLHPFPPHSLSVYNLLSSMIPPFEEDRASFLIDGHNVPHLPTPSSLASYCTRVSMPGS